MKIWLYRGAMALAVAFLILTVVNASWLAPTPQGNPKLIAHRGVAQLYDKEGVGRDTCTADRIEEPVHDYLENTLPSMAMTLQVGAQMIEVDIAPTSDGEIAVFHDWTLDCRTNGSGDTRDASMAELQALDAGYGYTADGGATFPFRGNPDNRIPTLEEALQVLSRRAIVFNFKSRDPAEADLLAEKLEASGRRVERMGDAFYGHPDVIARIREYYPDAWSWTAPELEECSRDYVAYGWTGYLPQSCRGRTLVVPLDKQWAFWGWPNRAIARMEAHGGRVLVIGPMDVENHPRGLALPEQLEEIPSTYNGYVWVEDIWTIGPALRPSADRRRADVRAGSEDALPARRARFGLD
ncbi:glycerophosphodiester phosphodiesterase family protein [Aurantiacibacter sp. MUD61]|uniref:glycerophosphodiester phosphodiesterase family protein n=1 Tax=Aurantiacibacter sp. MUD61 TaxID=3009083 RepID=UPI0022F0C01F|nr:glycerophosphodiester phosphodiesterase family protein [Aurantiacibacter sp. MUD61]